MSTKKKPQFQKTIIFNPPILLRQNRQVKKGGILGTPPPNDTWHTFPDDTWHAFLSGLTPSGFPPKVHVVRFSYSDSLRERHTTLTNITSGRPTYPIRICLSGSLTEVSKSCMSLQQSAMVHVSPPVEWKDMNEMMTSHLQRSLTTATPPTISVSRP